MKIIDVLNLEQSIDVLSEVKHMQFAYALMKNKKIIETERELLNQGLIPIESYKEFVDKVTALTKEYCDLKDKPDVLTKKSLTFIEGKDAQEFFDKLDSLHEEYKSAIQERRKQLNDYNQFLQTDVDINLYKIKESNLPEGLSFAELFPLSIIVDFFEHPLKEIELSNFEILTYLDLFLKDISDATCRNKLLHNALIFKQEALKLMSTDTIKNWTIFENKRKALAESHAEIDIYGEILVYGSKEQVGNQYAIKDKEAFDADLTKLNAEYESELKEFYDFLSLKTTVKVAQISQDELPSDVSFKDLKSLELFII